MSKQKLPEFGDIRDLAFEDYRHTQQSGEPCTLEREAFDSGWRHALEVVIGMLQNGTYTLLENIEAE